MKKESYLDFYLKEYTFMWLNVKGNSLLSVFKFNGQ